MMSRRGGKQGERSWNSIRKWSSMHRGSSLMFCEDAGHVRDPVCSNHTVVLIEIRGSARI